MTRNSKLEVSLALFLALATYGARATYAADDAAQQDGGKPCLKVRQACEAAGFVKGEHKKDGKGLFMDCVKPISEGKTIEGVKVDAADAQACKERREKREERRAARKADHAAAKSTK